MEKTIRDSGNNVQNFKRLNIIYGRNYSGKTTLSRIFRSLEIGQIPSSYAAPSFAAFGDIGPVTHNNVATHGYDIRVYNRDFVSENLSFLVNQSSGEIKTFAIVGDKNKKIEDDIFAIETKLGSVETKTGLRYDLERKGKNRDSAIRRHSEANESLNKKLRTHANDNIKKNREYGSAIYNIENIKRDISIINDAKYAPLTTDEQQLKFALLKQEALPEITKSLNITLKANDISKAAKNLLSRTITPTQPIQELLNNSILQSWVKHGISLHRVNRDRCAFCRQDLPKDIWETLDSHFSKESSDLEAEIDRCLSLVMLEISAIPSFLTLTSDNFYPEDKSAFEHNSKSLTEALKIYRQYLESLKSALETRKASLFENVEMPIFSLDLELIDKCVKTINVLIKQSNGRAATLEKDKRFARETLRLTNVKSFCEAIDHNTEIARIAELKKEEDAAKVNYASIAKEILKLEAEVTHLKGKQKDERKGAERVNALLSHFFGHDTLKLEARENIGSTTVKFEITRDGKSAFNLSEGECSLIAFCYFIAKLEEPSNAGKNLIIYIDDPISSLDGNHIFFMFSLIESLIAKPVKNSNGSNSYKYKQLFISTHNLDFLKYLKKMSFPDEKNHGGHQYFLIERNGTASKICLMPKYLRDYVTEFNYLFHQIYKCHNSERNTTNHEPFYSFGNNLRKFLEAFLFYKYPCHGGRNDTAERLEKFFGNDGKAVALANRINNEFSHLEESFDRSIKPIEIPEIQKLATYVLEKIKEADIRQYNALLKSIGEPEIPE